MWLHLEQVHLLTRCIGKVVDASPVVAVNLLELL
jgi:hypothetical protein